MNNISTLTIKQLLSEKEYRIPIYQRNYAWGIPEVTQLIQDIADYAKENASDNYYIGTLVVFPRDDERYYETIDGQQRSTTLTIIACSLLHNSSYDMSWYKGVNVSFDHRDRSTSTLVNIYNYADSYLNAEKLNSEIITVYNQAWHIIEKVCRNKELNIESFLNYFFSHVIIMRVSVPSDTDLNHYFEIMNSRGEQLEYHEIVKSFLMSSLKESPEQMKAFNIIWEACSNMSRYVQMNIGKAIREYIFRDNGIDDIIDDFDALSIRISQVAGQQESDEKCLIDLFVDDKNDLPYEKPWEEQGKNKEMPESFTSVISFSNFLLHVLKIINPKDTNIVLDDKKLISIFKTKFDNADNKSAFSKDFIMKLLKIRYLFDKYIIKRKFEKWSLKQLKLSSKDKLYYGSTFSMQDNSEDENEHNIIMLQAMFHVSLPSQIYKHWLNAALLYVYNKPDTNAYDFGTYLWTLAKSYMLDRYLASEGSVYTFENIIYDHNGEPQNKVDKVDWTNINIDNCEMIGEHVENFVFNFYDYLLYKEKITSDFEYSYRTSVEHFYPQHPSDKKPMEFRYLHSFGNLCLVSSSMNSKFTNNLPGAKYSNFGTDKEQLKTYSIKLQNMMQCIQDHDIWNEEKILEEEKNAKELFVKYLVT